MTERREFELETVVQIVRKYGAPILTLKVFGRARKIYPTITYPRVFYLLKLAERRNLITSRRAIASGGPLQWSIRDAE